MAKQHEHPFVHTHHACPSCNSSDGASTRSDGSVFCFVCDKEVVASQATESSREEPWFNAPQTPHRSQQEKVPAQRPRGQVQQIPARQLDDLAALKKYEYEVDADGNHLAPYFDGMGRWVATKVRTPDKQFRWVGNGSAAGLFGSQIQPKPDAYHDTIVVCEGEIDAITVRSTKMHAVSLPGGAGSVDTVLRDESIWSYLTQWPKVIVALDGDKPGREASERLCSQLCMSHRDLQVHQVSWPDGIKDANDMRMHRHLGELQDALKNAPAWRPSGIHNAAELISLLDEPDNDGVPYPFAAFDMLKGMRQGELITVTAGTGVGKSTLTRTLALHLIQNHGLRVGMIMLEESNRRTIKALVGMSAGRPLLTDSQCMTVEEQKTELTKIAGLDSLWLYDHFGSTDAEGLLSRMSYLAAGCRCDWLILDHVTMATTLGLANQHHDERKIIDAVCTEIRSKICERAGTGVIMVAHTRKPSAGDHSSGTASLSLADIRGSGSPAALSDAVIGLEKVVGDDGDRVRDQVRVNIMKNRYTGETSSDAGMLFFNRQTGRLEEGGTDFTNDVPF